MMSAKLDWTQKLGDAVLLIDAVPEQRVDVGEVAHEVAHGPPISAGNGTTRGSQVNFMVKPNGRLVLVSFMHYCTSTSSLSNT